MLQVKDHRGFDTASRGSEEIDSYDLANQLVSGARASGNNSNYPKRRGRQKFQDKPKQSPASPRTLAAAEAWVGAGEKSGVERASNAPWLSHQIAAKISRDTYIQNLLRHERIDQVSRLLEKMAVLYWSDYFTEAIKPRDAVFDFLDETWDDLRDYAVTCLTAAWLKVHGRRVGPPVYDEREDQEMQQALKEVRVQEWLRLVKAESEPPVGPRLDSEHKDVLKSRLREENGEDG